MDVLGALLLGIISGVIAGLMLRLILVWWSRSKRMKAAIAIGFGVFVAAAVTLYVFHVRAPYSVENVDWRVAGTAAEQRLEVSGRATKNGTAVHGLLTQVKLFQPGSANPLQPEKLTTTDEEGRFVVSFGPPLPTPGRMYLINIAYRYHGIFGERWAITDFERDAPGPE